MSIATLPQPVDIDRSGNGKFDHFYCPCTPDLGLCGADLAGMVDVSPVGRSDRDCPLCVALSEANAGVCARCGR